MPNTPSQETRNLELLRSKIKAEELDAIVAVTRRNVFYLSNAPTALSWQQGRADGPRICFVVWPLDKPARVIVGELEREVTEEYSWIDPVETYPEYSQTPFEKLSQVLQDMDLRGKRIGIERKAIGVRYWEELAGTLTDTTFIEASPLLESVRAKKTPAEVDLARRACHMLDQAFQTLFSSARRGSTELELDARMRGTLHEMGAREILGGLLTGDRAMVIHRPPTSKPLERGDVIRTDYVAEFGGRMANLSRMAILGPPNRHQQATYAALREVELAILHKIRHGVSARDLFRFYADEMRRRGWTSDLPLLGHGIGVDVHEDPMIVAEETGNLEEDMVLCIEPHVLKQYQIQDQVLVTHDGIELLSGDFETSELYVIG